MVCDSRNRDRKSMVYLLNYEIGTLYILLFSLTAAS